MNNEQGQESTVNQNQPNQPQETVNQTNLSQDGTQVLSREVLE